MASSPGSTVIWLCLETTLDISSLRRRALGHEVAVLRDDYAGHKCEQAQSSAMQNWLCKVRTEK
jgi:hypothetical protein